MQLNLMQCDAIQTNKVQRYTIQCNARKHNRIFMTAQKLCQGLFSASASISV